ncbi:hypothetical protein YUYDRAFT_07075 [Streptomyces sp. ScaeMP-e48]|nr:hypothetical protein YUYDRAFT_07075 [Streptomyces sp. ScaeMP-e48]
MRHRVGLPLGRGDAQSHADLCLTPLTGVRPEAFGNVWSTVLNEADRVLVARQEEEADGEDKVLHGMLAMMDLACRAAAEDNLTQAATSLVLCGSLAQSLTWRVCRSLRTARRTALHPPTRASEPDTDGRRHSEHNPGSLGKDPVDCAPCEAPDGHPLLKGLPRFHVRGPAEKLFEEAYDWARPMTDAECMLRHLVGIDVNMAFAAGANGLVVGLGEPTHVKTPAFDPKLPGSWLVDLSHADLSRVKAGKEWVELDGSLLPSPFTPKGDRPKGPAWYATPTVAYAVELGYDVTPTEAYVRYENGRYLDGWYQRLRDAYLATMAGLGVGADLAPADFLTAMDGYRSRDPELAIVVSAIKATVKGGLGKLRERPRGEGWRPGEPWRALSRPTWRPDIRAAVIARTRVNLHRKIVKHAAFTGQYPVAVLSDCVVYAANGESPLDFLPYREGKPLPGGFKLGINPGLVKHEGTQSLLWGEEVRERFNAPELNLARYIKDGTVTDVDNGE